MGFLRVHKCQTAAKQRVSDEFVLENLGEEKKEALNDINKKWQLNEMQTLGYWW